MDEVIREHMNTYRALEWFKESAEGVYVKLLQMEREYQQQVLNERIKASREYEEHALQSAKKYAQGRIDEIDGQLAALDKMLEDKRSKDKDEEELVKIDRLKAKLEYEHDDIHRIALQKELDRAIDARDDRLFEEGIKQQKNELAAKKADIKEHLAADIERIKDVGKAERDSYSEYLNWLKNNSNLTTDKVNAYMQQSMTETIKHVGEYYNNVITGMLENMQRLLYASGARTGYSSSNTYNSTFSPTYNLNTPNMTPAQIHEQSHKDYSAAKFLGNL